MLHRSFKYHIFAVLIMCTVCIAAYSNTLKNPFVFDDIRAIEENSSIRIDHLDFKKLWQAGFLGSFSKRPVVDLSFKLNYYLGGYNVTGYHIVNIAIHFINGLLVYILAQMMFGQLSASPVRQPGEAAGSGKLKAGSSKVKAESSKLEGERLKPEDQSCYDYSLPVFYCSLFAALIFIVHPIQTQAVTYIVQRYTSMAAMFYLGSIMFYLKARIIAQSSKVKGQSLVSRPLSAFSFQLSALYSLSILCGLLAFLSKQNTASLPMAILLVEYIFIDQTWQGWKKKIIWIIPVFVLFAACILLFLGVFGGGGQGANLLEDILEHTRETKLVGRWSYLCTQFNVLAMYVGLLFLPLGQNLDYMYPFKTGFFDGITPLAFLFLTGLAAVGLWSIKKRPVITFAIFWFFITLSVESSIIPIRDAMFEHRLYLPMYGFAIGVSYAVFQLLSKRKALACIVSVAVIATMGTAAYLRNGIWANGITLWSDVLSKNPQNYRAHTNLGKFLVRRGDLSQGIRHFLEALRINPDHVIAHYNLGNAMIQQGDLESAIIHFSEVVRIKPDDADAHLNLGNALAQKGDLKGAVSHFSRAIEIRPGFASAHYNMGTALAGQGKLKKAYGQFQKALRIEPENAEIHNNLGVVLARQGMFEKAIAHFSEALRIRPEYVEARLNLKSSIWQSGRSGGSSGFKLEPHNENP
ncbi:MAG TPA: tetratricopeptide repeat protein [Desulfobacteraceae bacterium]|nr:tetratricopeptide repeat protein [Desulfobacteraceae bacterium]HPJ67747.1 tetratricopeptide repeat protein [Desulfobacteraceae bacterium]HPQ28103.1 tetratricopeptide repeat protein [Desulfobacteraceae bacterium]